MATNFARFALSAALAAACAPVLAQKGLTIGQANTLYSAQAETKAQKFRRLLARADISNAVTAPTLVGSTGWSPGASVVAGQILSAGGNAYAYTSSGVTASAGPGPAGRGAGQTDGSASCDYVGPQTAPQIMLSNAAPSYLLNNGSSDLAWNDPRIRVLGCANPLSSSSQYVFGNVSCGVGGLGQTSAGASVGQPIAAGLTTTHWGVQICTDAPVICFVTNNANWAVNFIVEQNGVKQYVSPVPFQGTSSYFNYWVVDFTKTTQIASTNGVNAPPGTGATFTVGLTGTSVTSCTVTNGGQGYSASNPPSFILYGGGSQGTPCQITPVINSSGVITSGTINSPGYYTSTPTGAVQGGRARRIITLETGETNSFYKVLVGSFDTIWAIPMTDRVRAACLGDSWTEGFTQSVSTRRLGMANIFCHLMGWDDCINAGAGGTDYTVPMVPFSATVTSGSFSTGPQTVTLGNINATNGALSFPLTVGSLLWFDTGANLERVQVSAVNVGAKTVTAAFAKSHAASCTATGYLNYLQCATTVTSGAITGSGVAQTVTVATTLNPNSGNAMGTGNKIYVDPLGANPEVVQITAISGSGSNVNVTGVFTQSHAAGCVVVCMSTEFNINHNLRWQDVAWADSATFANRSGDTGNGTCSAITISTPSSLLLRNRVPGGYTFTAASSTMFTAVDGTGIALPNLTLGSLYTAGGLSFTVSAGGTAYVPGDVFTVYVVTQPDIIVIGPAGLNDCAGSGASSATIQTECQKLYANIRSVCPTTPIIWFGCNGSWASGSTWPPTVIETGIQAACAGFNDSNVLFVPVQLDANAWLAGNYNGYYYNPATGHPNDQGFSYLAQRMQAAVRPWIQAAGWP